MSNISISGKKYNETRGYIAGIVFTITWGDESYTHMYIILWNIILWNIDIYVKYVFYFCQTLSFLFQVYWRDKLYTLTNYQLLVAVVLTAAEHLCILTTLHLVVHIPLSTNYKNTQFLPYTSVHQKYFLYTNIVFIAAQVDRGYNGVSSNWRNRQLSWM